MEKSDLRYVLLFLFSLCSLPLWAQTAGNNNPVKWEFFAQEVAPHEYILYSRATIAKGWFLYSQHLPTSPPIPTSFSFTETLGATAVGSIEEKGTVIVEVEEGNQIRKYKDRVTFETRMRTTDDRVTVNGYVNYMTCNSNSCLPPRKQPFSFMLLHLPEVVATQSESFSVQQNKKYSTQSYAAADLGYEVQDEEAVASKRQAKAHQEVNIEQSNVLAAANLVKMMQPKPAPKEVVAEATPPAPAPQPAPPVVENPINWEFQLQKTEEAGIYVLQMKATPLPGWHLYAQQANGDIPLPTSFSFDDNPNIEWLDAAVSAQGNLISAPDVVFDKTTHRYEQPVTFSRRVKFNQNVTLFGKVGFMAADTLRYNMPQEQTFSFNDDLQVVPASQPLSAGWYVGGGLVAILLLGFAFLQARSKQTAA